MNSADRVKKTIPDFNPGVPVRHNELAVRLEMDYLLNISEWNSDSDTLNNEFLRLVCPDKSVEEKIAFLERIIDCYRSYDFSLSREMTQNLREHIRNVLK